MKYVTFDLGVQNNTTSDIGTTWDIRYDPAKHDINSLSQISMSTNHYALITKL